MYNAEVPSGTSFLTMKKSTSVVFISSTGGHLSELLQLSPLFAECDYHIVTEKTPSNAKLAADYPAGRVAYLSYGTKAHLLPYLFIFAGNIFKSWRLYKKWRPDYVISTGTHTAVPMCKIAHRHGARVIWIETMANATTPTQAGKMIYPIADLFVVQWESMRKVYPKAVYGGWIF
jgi:beta-1,4-N-acetylglucosaminyltransferase